MTPDYNNPTQEDIDEYAFGLLNEEAGEIVQNVGKQIRFGIDTPGVRDALTGVVDPHATPRTRMNEEAGDMMAAIQYAILKGTLDSNKVHHAFAVKLNKLLDPNSKDNMGRRLAP